MKIDIWYQIRVEDERDFHVLVLKWKIYGEELRFLSSMISSAFAIAYLSLSPTIAV